MTLDIKNTQREVNKRKFSELQKRIKSARTENSVFRATDSRRKRLVSLMLVMGNLPANITRSIRLHGGVREALGNSVIHLRNAGFKDTIMKISSELAKPAQSENKANNSSFSNTFDRQNPFKFKSKAEYEELYQSYLQNRDTNRNIAIFRAITDGYDQILDYEHFVSDADYYTFTDKPTMVPGLNLPVPHYDVSSTRRARFVKLHPHILFPDHDIAVWHDGNVMIRQDIRPLIQKLLSSNMPIGAFLHPWHENIYDEALACIQTNKDNRNLILNQVEQYSDEGFLSQNLIESNFLIYNLKHPELRSVLAKWWAELDRGSCRDQLSFNYAIESTNTSFFPLSERPICVRNYSSFAFFANHGNRSQKNSSYKSDLVVNPKFSYQTNIAKQTKGSKADVLVCVHNARDDVRECLNSVLEEAYGSVRNLIIIDDGSDHLTQQFLVEIAVKNKNVILARNDEALGYTKAANMAISLSKSENLVLLNSDTVIGARALRKMLNCIDTQTGCGIVGPLSNAASSQSIPNHLSTVGQTAINALPKGYSVSQMDSWCEENSRDLTSPSVPFVHGFCMCVKREVFDKIGYFDEESFPYGYGEENDLCIRASEEGYRLNIAVDAFVFHSKSKSYSDERRRKSLMKAGNIKLRDLHGTERVDRLVQSMQQNPTLAKMRDRSLALY